MSISTCAIALKRETTFDARPIICVSSTKEGKTQIRWAIIIGRKMHKWTRVNNIPSNGFPIVYLTLTKWLWNPHVKKPGKNIMGMGVCKIVKQMGRVDPNNQAKTVTLEKWLIVTLNWRCYKHPPISPPNLDTNLTLLEYREPLFHTHLESLHQIDED